jgi:type IV pilus assembly protein PilE
VKYFSFRCALTPAGYTITATGIQAGALGHVYTVNESNLETTTQFKGAAVAKNCWLSKGSEC